MSRLGRDSEPLWRKVGMRTRKKGTRYYTLLEKLSPSSAGWSASATISQKQNWRFLWVLHSRAWFCPRFRFLDALCDCYFLCMMGLWILHKDLNAGMYKLSVDSKKVSTYVCRLYKAVTLWRDRGARYELWGARSFLRELSLGQFSRQEIYPRVFTIFSFNLILILN